jgi:HSP20 family protein
MSSDMVELMRALLLPNADVSRSVRWQPPVDIYRLSDGWLVKFDLAGVRPQDLDVTVSGRHLVVRGKRRDRIVERHLPCQAYSMEITYSEFQRVIELPGDLEQLHVLTDYTDGMLLVQLRMEGSDR